MNKPYRYVICYNHEDYLGEGVTHDVFSDDLDKLKQHIVDENDDPVVFTKDDDSVLVCEIDGCCVCVIVEGYMSPTYPTILE